MKRLIKKRAEEIKTEWLRTSLKNKKETYDRYAKVLAKYAIDHIGVCTGAIYFDDLFHNELQAIVKEMEKIKDEKKKGAAMMDLMFGKRLTTNEFLREQIDHTSKLIKIARHKIKDLPQELKIKIVKEGIESLDKWSRMFDKRAKLVQLDKQIEKIRKNDGRKRNHKKKKAVRRRSR